MTPRKKFVVLNWKLHPETLDEARVLAAAARRAAVLSKRTEVVLCPPAVFLSSLKPRRKVKHFALGAQDVFYERLGEFTGEVSAPLLREVGAGYVIVGHSERRLHGDDDAVIAKKLMATIHEGLTAILCIGEKEHGEEGAYLNVLREQLKSVLGAFSREDVERLIVAYEPVWAVGEHSKGMLSPHALSEAAIFIRKIFADTFGEAVGLSVPVLYGGSVDPEHAGSLLRQGGVAGILVGRASLDRKAASTIIASIDALP